MGPTPGVAPEITPAPAPPPDAAAAVSDTLTKTMHAYVTAEANDAGIPPEWALAHLVAESSDGHNAGTSSAGAKGPMQLMDKTARRYGIDPTEPVNWAENIHAGVRELASLSDRFHGDLVLASAGYNSDPDKVEARVARGGLAGLPPETQKYLGKIAAAYPGLFDSRNAAPLPLDSPHSAAPTPSASPESPHGGGTGEWTSDVPGFFRDMVVPLAANFAENVASGTLDQAQTATDPNANAMSRVGAAGTLGAAAIPGVGPWTSAVIFGGSQLLSAAGKRQQAAQDAGTPVDPIHAVMSLPAKDVAEIGASAIAMGAVGRLFNDNSFRGLKGMTRTEIQAAGSEARRASGLALEAAPVGMRTEARALLEGTPSPAAGTVSAAYESIPTVPVDASKVADAIDTHLAQGRSLSKTVTTLRDNFTPKEGNFVPVWEPPVGYQPARMSLVRLPGEGYNASSQDLLNLNMELGKQLNPKFAAESGTSAQLGDLRALHEQVAGHIGTALDQAITGGGAKFAAAGEAAATAAMDRKAAGMFVKYLNPENGLFNPTAFGGALRKIGVTKAIGEENQAFLLRATDALTTMTERDPSVAGSILHALWTGERMGAVTGAGVGMVTGGPANIGHAAAIGGGMGMSAVILARAARVASRVFTDPRIVKEMEFLAKGSGSRTGVMAEHLGRAVAGITMARTLDEQQQGPEAPVSPPGGPTPPPGLPPNSRVPPPL